MSSLYSMTADYEHVLQMLYDEEYDEQAVIDTLDSIEGAIEDKADGYAMIMRELEADAAKLKAEEDRLRARRTALENHKNRLKAHLYESMKAVGKPKFKTTLFSFGIQKNGGKRALVLDCGVDKLPPELQMVTVAANNDAIRAYLMDTGEESCEFAHLAPQGEHLVIR